MWQRSFAFVADSQSDLPNKLCESCDCMFIEIDDLAKVGRKCSRVLPLSEWSSGPPLPRRRHEDLDVGACVQSQLGDGEWMQTQMEDSISYLFIFKGDHRAVAEVSEPHQPGSGWDRCS